MDRTYVYIDGLNLYYRAVKNTPYRWLNLAEVCNLLLPKHDVRCIRYYTAIVANQGDGNAPNRQQLYLRALATLPNVSVSLGHFLTHTKRMRLAKQPHDRVNVIVPEEKGSDVNLATHLVHDAHCDRYDVAVVVSNDTDLVEPVRVVRDEIGKRIGVISPSFKNAPSLPLRNAASFVKRLREPILRDSQFPTNMSDANGSFYKPPSW